MPLLIAMITIVSRKWGNVTGGVIAGLPWVGGAILLFISIEQGKEFVLEALPAVYIGLICWMVYTLLYVIVGQKLSPFFTLFIGLIGYLLVGAILQKFSNQLPAVVWFLLSVLSLSISLWFFPKVKEQKKKETIKKIKFEIPLRMLMITAFVITLTFFAKPLGPEWSGVLTPFPVITAVLTVFTHLTQGMKQVRVVLVGMYTGVVGFLTFLLAVIFFLPNFSIALSYTAAFLLCIAAAFLAKTLFAKFSLFQGVSD